MSERKPTEQSLNDIIGNCIEYHKATIQKLQQAHTYAPPMCRACGDYLHDGSVALAVCGFCSDNPTRREKELAERVATLEKELQALQADASEVFLQRFEGQTLEVRTKIAYALVGNLAHLLNIKGPDGKPASNFLAIAGYHPDLGKVGITIQRMNPGLDTPAAKLLRQEAQIEEFTSAVKRVEAALWKICNEMAENPGVCSDCVSELGGPLQQLSELIGTAFPAHLEDFLAAGKGGGE